MNKMSSILNHFVDSSQMQYQPNLAVTTLLIKISVR